MRWRKDRADASVNVLINPLLQNLKAELARSRSQVCRCGAALRPESSASIYERPRAEVESLRSRVAGRKSPTPLERLPGKAQVARQNTADLQRSMEQQRKRKRILDLQHNQDEFSVLKRDAEESARAAYDSALQRGSQTRLESRLDQTNIAILNYAFVPIDPASPRLFLNIAVGGDSGFHAGRRRESDPRTAGSPHFVHVTTCWRARLPYSRSCLARGPQRGSSGCLAGYDFLDKEPRVEPV